MDEPRQVHSKRKKKSSNFQDRWNTLMNSINKPDRSQDREKGKRSHNKRVRNKSQIPLSPECLSSKRISQTQDELSPQENDLDEKCIGSSQENIPTRYQMRDYGGSEDASKSRASKSSRKTPTDPDIIHSDEISDLTKVVEYLNDLSNGMSPLYSFWKNGFCCGKKDAVIEGVRIKIELLCKNISQRLGRKPKYGHCPDNYVELFTDHGHILIGNIGSKLQTLEGKKPSMEKSGDRKRFRKDCRKVWGMILMFYVQFWNLNARQPISFWDAWTVALQETRQSSYHHYIKIILALKKWLMKACEDPKKKIEAASDTLGEYSQVMNATLNRRTQQESETE